MPKKTHLLKTEPTYFKDVWLGFKTFEIRKNDRNFLPDDQVVLTEVSSIGVTGRAVIATIGSVYSYEQKLGYVVFSLLSVSRHFLAHQSWTEEDHQIAKALTPKRIGK